jgi:hypothetical protein
MQAITAIEDALPALEPAGTVYHIRDDMFMRDGSLNRDHEDLSALRSQTTKHVATLTEYKEALASCNALRRRLEAQLADIEQSPKRARTGRSPFTARKRRPEDVMEMSE